jgi:DtxR family transcriptional regulator, Mn-dependent transcriptional regulator
VPSSTVEDYLKQIFLEQQGDPELVVGMGRLATALSLAPGTVTSMIKTLAESGLVEYEPYTGVRLTASGRGLALRVVRRHRLIELFLVQVLGIDWTEVHPEAERLEHAMSDALVDRIDEMLGKPAVDPHGDPIPTAGGEVVEPDYPSLLGCRRGVPLLVARITDQDPAFLQLVEREGLVPGQGVTQLGTDEAADTVLVEVADGREVRLGYRAASKILVQE